MKNNCMIQSVEHFQSLLLVSVLFISSATKNNDLAENIFPLLKFREIKQKKNTLTPQLRILLLNGAVILSRTEIQCICSHMTLFLCQRPILIF